MTRTRIAEEAAWLRSCQTGACRDVRVSIWQATVSVVKAAPFKTRAALAQKLLGRQIRYTADRRSDDHWASPLRTLLNGFGDCEDHALLKRALLLSSGYTDDDLRLLILETATGRGHVALEVSGLSTPILDNRFRAPVPTAFLAGERVAAVATGKGYFSVR